MIILGIDPGFERVGIALINKKDGQKEEYIYSECFKTATTFEFSERLLLIGVKLKNIIKDYQPDAVAIEKLFFTTNQKTAMHVAEARGVIVFQAALGRLPVYEYGPMEIKVAITGYGKSDKTAVMSMVPKLLIVPEKEMLDDEVDALAVALTHSAYIGGKFSTIEA